MSYGILKFKLPEEDEEFKTAQEGGSLRAALWDISEHLRRKYKYAQPSSEEAHKEYEDIKNEFFSILERYEIKLA